MFNTLQNINKCSSHATNVYLTHRKFAMFVARPQEATNKRTPWLSILVIFWFGRCAAFLTALVTWKTTTQSLWWWGGWITDQLHCDGLSWDVKIFVEKFSWKQNLIHKCLVWNFIHHYLGSVYSKESFCLENKALDLLFLEIYKYMRTFNITIIHF